MTVVVEKHVETILDWPTDTVSISHHHEKDTATPHTLLLFIPGNPGLCGWYIPIMKQLIEALGDGYAAHLCSYAGHGVTPETVNVEAFAEPSSHHQHQQQQHPHRDTRIPWTVNGQVLHKMEWLMGLFHNHPHQRLVFCSHSIGSHLVQRMLLLSPRLLRRTDLVLHWMPFIRMDAPRDKQIQLNTVAYRPDTAIAIVQTALAAFRNFAGNGEGMDRLLQTTVPDSEGRALAVQLLQHPTFGRNFLELGTEEIRDVPVLPDLPALRLITRHCPVAMAFCGNDHWAPLQHMHDLEALKLPNLSTEYFPGLKHDFVVHPSMVPPIFQFSLQHIQRAQRRGVQGKL